MSTHAEFQQANPMRPLDWQWQRAKSLVADRRRYRPDCDDAATELAMKFLRARRRWGNSTLGREMPDLWQAVQLYEQNSPTRWLIESRLLARQSPSEIAGLLSVSAASVAIYEKLFFDVTDRLDAKCFVAKQAIGLTGAGTSENLHPAAVLKWFGYFGGPVVLDVVAPIILNAGSTVRTEASCVTKTHLLASLLALPRGSNPVRLLGLLADLAKTTRVGRAYLDSPLAGVSDQLVAVNTVNMSRSLPEDAVPEEPEKDISSNTGETREAA